MRRRSSASTSSSSFSLFLLHLEVRVAREHAAGGGAELGAHQLVVVVGPDLDVEIVELGDHGAEDQRHLEVHRQAFRRDGVDLLLAGRVGDVEVVDAIKRADPMHAGPVDPLRVRPPAPMIVQKDEREEGPNEAGRARRMEWGAAPQKDIRDRRARVRALPRADAPRLRDQRRADRRRDPYAMHGPRTFGLTA